MDEVEEVDLPEEYADERNWSAERARERVSRDKEDALGDEELNDAKFYLCRLRSDIWDLTEETLIPRWTGKWESLNSS